MSLWCYQRREYPHINWTSFASQYINLMFSKLSREPPSLQSLLSQFDVPTVSSITDSSFKKKTVSSSISSDNLWNRTLSPPILVLWFWFRLFVLISHSGSPHHLLQSGFAPTWDDSLDLSLLQLRRNHRKYFQFLWTFLETIDVTAHPRLQSKCC